MTYTINTTVAPTEGFTGLNMGYERYSLSPNVGTNYFANDLTLTRLPSGIYLLSCENNELLTYNSGQSSNWYKIAEISGAGITGTTFKTVYFWSIFSVSAAAVEVKCRYNYSNNPMIEMTTNDPSSYVNLLGNFQIFLIPQS